MSPEMVGILALVAFVVLLLAGVHVGVVGAVVGVGGVWLLVGAEGAMTMVANEFFSIVMSFTFAVVPLFVLMGSLVSFSGIMGNVYEAAMRWLGRFPGGLAMAAVAGCAMLAAACGSSVACTATMAKVSIPEMTRLGYAARLAAGAVAAGGSIAILIPPSVALVVFGMLTGTSVGKLLLAGFIPGITEAVLYAIAIWIVVRLNPSLAPPYTRVSTWAQRIVSLKSTWPIMVLLLVVMGSIYTGLATPTEAGAVGALGALVIVFLMRRLSRTVLTSSLRDAVITTSSIFFIVIGAIVFTRVITLSHLPTQITEFLAGLDVPPVVVLTGVLVMYIILGTFMDGFAMMVLTLPTVFPLITGLGYSPVWFGVMMIRTIEIGLITPPFGLNVFVLKATVPYVPMNEIWKGIVPFFIADLVSLVLFTAFPQMVLFLPDTALK